MKLEAKILAKAEALANVRRSCVSKYLHWLIDLEYRSVFGTTRAPRLYVGCPCPAQVYIAAEVWYQSDTEPCSGRLRTYGDSYGAARQCPDDSEAMALHCPVCGSIYDIGGRYEDDSGEGTRGRAR